MIAEGVDRGVARRVGLKVPLVVRMKGTNEELGQQDPGRVRPADHQPPTTMAEAAQKVVAAAQQGYKP